jgi:hypothetical protein
VITWLAPTIRALPHFSERLKLLARIEPIGGARVVLRCLQGWLGSERYVSERDLQRALDREGVGGRATAYIRRLRTLGWEVKASPRGDLSRKGYRLEFPFFRS